MAIIINARGTTESSFFISKNGPRLKNNNGALELRNYGDNGYIEVKAATPTEPDSLSTKQYVDGVASGLTVKFAVRATTNGASDLSGFTYTPASDDETQGAAPWTDVTAPVFDSVSLVDGDRVLIKDSADAKGNGVFVYDDTNDTFVRAADADNTTGNEVTGGLFVFVSEGTIHQDNGWTLASPDESVTLGVDDLVFTQFSNSASVTAGDGLTKNGTVIDVGGTTNRISVNGDSVDISANYVGQTSITTLGTIVDFSSTGIDNNATATTITIDGNNNVGIGTTSPNSFAKLDVNGGVHSTQNTIASGLPSGTILGGEAGVAPFKWKLGPHSNGNDLQITLTDTDNRWDVFHQFTIQATTGNVGVGTIATDAKLTVEQSVDDKPSIVAVSSDASYTNDVLRTETNRAAGSEFNHIKSISDVNGTSDPVFRVQGDGLVFADGAYSGAGADYADYFEWEDGNPNNEDRVGCSVVLTTDGKIQIAEKNQNPIGVISGRPSVAGNAAADSWSDKFLKDEFHRYILENGKKVINPNYDPNVEYTPRPDRPEWDAVGLVGRLPVKKGQVISALWTKIRDISDSVEEWLIASGGTSNIITTNNLETTALDFNDYSELSEEDATRMKLTELSEQYYLKLSEGFEWRYETFDIDERAQYNISAEFMFYAQSSEKFPKGFEWRGYENQYVKMTNDEFNDFVRASRSHVAAMREAKVKHEKAINRKRLAKTVMAYDVTTDWPKTAVDFLSTKTD